MPEPKPLTQCTPAPRAPQPTSKPAANPTSRGAVGVKQKVRAAPTMAEQEAALAPLPKTTAMAGQPMGTALEQVQAATEAARKDRRLDKDLGAQIHRASSTQGNAARMVGSYLPDLIDHQGRANYPRYIAEARADHGMYRTAEASTALVVPTWTLAYAISTEADVRYDAALRSLDQAGLASRAKGTVDASKVVSEGQIYTNRMAQSGLMVETPRTDGGAIKSAMANLVATGVITNMAVGNLYAQVLERRADAAQDEIDRKSKALSEITGMVSAVVDLVRSPGPQSAIAFTTQLIGAMRGPTELEAEVIACRELAKDEHERIAWTALDHAMKSFTSARLRVEGAMSQLARETEATRTNLNNHGAEADAKDHVERTGGHRKAPPAPERIAAMGQHIATLIEAQRFTSAASDGWSAVAPALDHAATVAEQATQGLRVPEVLAEAKDRMVAPATFLSSARGFHAQVQARYAQRLSVLGPGVKAVVSELSTLSAAPQDAKR